VPKAKFKGVELVRSPMRADDSSARFISMSLKTSKYSLGGALCCCHVQPSHKPEAFRAHPALTAPQFCGAGKAVAKVRSGCAHRPQDGARRLSPRSLVSLFRRGVVPSGPEDAYLANLERHGSRGCVKWIA